LDTLLLAFILLAPCWFTTWLRQSYLRFSRILHALYLLAPTRSLTITMVNATILAGGYTSFIAAYLFNSDLSSLTFLNKFPTGENPSWIALGASDNSILYATNEIEQGALQSFAVAPGGILSSAIDTVSSGGNGPAFAVSLSSGQVAVMNFDSGDGLVIPTPSSPFLFDTSARLITFPVPEGTSSHPHSAYEFGQELLVPDLGADKVWRLVEDGAPGAWKIQGSIDQPKGSGPRHAVIQDNTLFTLHELDNTLTAQDIGPAPNGTSVTLATISIAPTDSGVPAGAKFAAAEILMPAPSASFPSPLIYASNRNTGTEEDPRGDSIAILQFVSVAGRTAEFRLVAQVFTGLQQIRGMAFSGDGQFLVAAGSKSGGVKVFERVDGGAGLREVASNGEVDTRTSFVWV